MNVPSIKPKPNLSQLFFITAVFTSCGYYVNIVPEKYNKGILSHFLKCVKSIKIFLELLLPIAKNDIVYTNKTSIFVGVDVPDDPSEQPFLA